jgi:hypothetical protein
MSAAAPPPDLPPPSRSGRLLTLVCKLVDYGRHLVATLGQSTVPADAPSLVRAFGTSDIPLILARIANGLLRARHLEEKINRTAARIDAEPPKPVRPRSPRTRRREAQPSSRRQDRDPNSTIAALPTPDQIAAKVRRQSIGAVIADICRDLGITPSHPLWRELHAAIDEFGGNYPRVVIDLLKRALPLAANAIARLKAKPTAPPEPAGTGPPLTSPA